MSSSETGWFAEFRNKISSLINSDFFLPNTPTNSQTVSLMASKRKSPRSSVSHSASASDIFPPNARWPLNSDSDEDNNIMSVSTPTYMANEDQIACECPVGTDDSYNDWLDAEQRRYYDTLELQHFGAEMGLIPVGNKDLGSGHQFYVVQLVNPTWCDKCGDFIWGFYKQAVRCQRCNYTCHYRCRMLVTLDCRSLSDSMKSTKTDVTLLPPMSECSTLSDSQSDLFSSSCPSTVLERIVGQSQVPLLDEDQSEVTDITELDWDTKTVINTQKDQNYTDDLLDSTLTEFPQTAIEAIITKYNDAVEDGLKMTLEENGVVFRGFLRIHMNFSRPINVIAGEKPPTLYDVVNDSPWVERSGNDTIGRKTITSFYLPRNTEKILHVTSDTTTHELIVGLLKKFKVADNPRKFALYERDLEPGQTLQARLKRISDFECPLRLALLWGSNSGKRLVLQENESGEIYWDAFEIPELQNFLRILQREEAEYIRQIKQKFRLCRQYLELEIRERGQIAEKEDDPIDRSFEI